MAEIFDESQKVLSDLVSTLTPKDEDILFMMTRLFDAETCDRFAVWLTVARRYPEFVHLREYVVYRCRLAISMLEGMGRKEAIEGLKAMRPLEAGEVPMEQHRGVIQRIKEAFRGRSS